MKFLIDWVENYSDRETYESRKDTLPHSEIVNETVDNVEVYVWDIFEADSSDEAKTYIQEFYDEVAVFDVFLLQPVFSEEDL
ncbi:hypothetical protein KSF_084290 [Reticulibacter mediterranei]|uniref:Uncharacterized protein n=1 Tax=Reticulibacter mediterranei TaxID=2778369 RepID=A0A8J3IPK4_9CHLR|nr:hypothetical protein [Reticulibacter mediterranei]GHO98381.1 hypothetical protein KSF_084290 [Reticulibacter mediterranei]